MIFGIWLALNRPEYEIYDGWIIAALVLWFLATGSGARASRGMRPVGPWISARIATGLVSLLLIGYLVAVWALTTKPS